MDHDDRVRLPRGARRKARSRAALIAAAQRLLADERTHVAISEITETADVGMGTFYNHFDSREALFRAAVADALDSYYTLIQELCADMDGPESFAYGFRATGRLNRTAPHLGRAILVDGFKLAEGPTSLTARARRDVETAMASGEFTVADLDAVMVIVVGSMLALARTFRDSPGTDTERLTDLTCEQLLRMLGLDAERAAQLAHQPMPQVPALG